MKSEHYFRNWKIVASFIISVLKGAKNQILQNIFIIYKYRKEFANFYKTKCHLHPVLYISVYSIENSSEFEKLVILFLLEHFFLLLSNFQCVKKIFLPFLIIYFRLLLMHSLYKKKSIMIFDSRSPPLSHKTLPLGEMPR